MTLYRVAANLCTNPEVRVEQVKGKDRLSLTGLDKLEEPASLITLRDQVDALLPRIDLTDAILEIHGYTGFADEFTHIRRSLQYRHRALGRSRKSGLNLRQAGLGAAELHSGRNADSRQASA
jgi:hypothetical protein